jgi:signal transduction histidine kinase
MKTPGSSFSAPAAAAVGIAVFAALFVFELARFRRAVTDWAARDLQARTLLAAAHLAEPLAAGDFGRVHDFGAACAEKGLRLTVVGPEGGVVYDSRRDDRDDPGRLVAEERAAGFLIRQSLPGAAVLAPFSRARTGFLLAALLGGLSVLAVFHFTYRQRVRIRELARLEAFRRGFVADLSHEIKTPLTGILAAADFIESALRGADPSANDVVALLRRETRRLDALVKDILSLARLEHGKDAAAFRRVDLSDLVSDTFARFAPRARAAGVALDLRLPPEPVVAVCDPALVGRALDNLAANVLVHAHARRATLSLDANDGVVRLRVEDDGRGVPPDAAPRVFERFYRADPARTSETGGSGLGLSIVKEIARLHGGSARLETVAPHGARFVFSFPAG